MKFFEKLKRDDEVMVIPGEDGPGISFGKEAEIPNGTCGTVTEGEGNLPFYDPIGVLYTWYGCYVVFPSFPTSHEKGWFLPRTKLMKINPEDSLTEEKMVADLEELIS